MPAFLFVSTDDVLGHICKCLDVLKKLNANKHKSTMSLSNWNDKSIPLKKMHIPAQIVSKCWISIKCESFQSLEVNFLPVWSQNGGKTQ